MYVLSLCGAVLLLLVAGCQTRRLQDFGDNTELTGTWRRSCSQIRGGYVRDSVDFGSSVVDVFQEAYQDDACSQLSNSFRMGGHYTLGSGRHKNIDINLTYLEITLHDADYVETYNALKMCDATDWQVGVAKNCPQHLKPFYQIYELKGFSTLYLGRSDGEQDASSPEKRPIELDLEQPYFR